MPNSLGEANLLTLGTLERCGEAANFIGGAEKVMSKEQLH